MAKPNRAWGHTFMTSTLMTTFGTAPPKHVENFKTLTPSLYLCDVINVCCFFEFQQRNNSPDIFAQKFKNLKSYEFLPHLFK